MHYIKWYVLLSELKINKSVETIGNIGLEKKIKKLPTFTWHKPFFVLCTKILILAYIYAILVTEFPG